MPSPGSSASLASAIRSAKELRKSAAFVLIALVIYRIGTYIPVPGVNPIILQQIFDSPGGSVLGIFDVFAGGSLKRMAIFALGIIPYISVSIVMQLLTVASPKLEQLRKEGERGRTIINQYTRYGTVALAMLQGYAVAIALESLGGQYGNYNVASGFLFRFTTALSLTGGTVFLMWLGEQITSRGIGNGISLIVFSGIVAEMPSAIYGTIQLNRSGSISDLQLLSIAVLAAASVALVVFVERSYRFVSIYYPKRMRGGKLYDSQGGQLPMKINTAGVIPPIFASALLLTPVTIAKFYTGASSPNWLIAITSALGPGQPIYLSIYVVSIAFFCFLYTAVMFNPQEVSEQLRLQGGIIPGVRPGPQTATHLDSILNRVTVIGAAYIAFICVVPQLLTSQFSANFYLGGTSILIVVSVISDTMTQIQSYVIAQQYEGVAKKSRLFRRKS